MSKWLYLLILALAASGCGGTGGCEPYIPQTAEITIYDSITGLPIACGTTVEVGPWSMQYPDSEGCNNDMKISPHLGNGEFNVLITKPGYINWTQHISVRSLNECGTITDYPKLEVFLVPRP
jgi:hypothetical protein